MPTAIWKSRMRSGSAHCDLAVAVEVRQCPLGSGARGGGPAVPTGIWRARGGGPAVPTGIWRARGGGPAVPTGIWTARRRRRVRRRRRQWRRRRRRRRRTALIKSNNPHLAGREKCGKPRWLILGILVALGRGEANPNSRLRTVRNFAKIRADYACLFLNTWLYSLTTGSLAFSWPSEVWNHCH